MSIDSEGAYSGCYVQGLQRETQGVDRNSIRIRRVLQDLYKSLLSVIAMDDI